MLRWLVILQRWWTGVVWSGLVWSGRYGSSSWDTESLQTAPFSLELQLTNFCYDENVPSWTSEPEAISFCITVRR
jgi:hypothetical protein